MPQPETKQKCKPDCRCGRHNAVHKPDCRCGRHYHKPAKPKPPPLPRGRHPNPAKCTCGHNESQHDPFGCKACERGVSAGRRKLMCHEFRSRAAHSEQATKDNIFEQEVRRNGFIRHIADLATCTTCWQSIKLGPARTLTSVIHARAHRQICIKRVRLERDGCSPNRTLGVS